MGVDTTKTKDLKEIKPTSKKYFKCPNCGILLKIEIDSSINEDLINPYQFIFPHLHIHGNPLHGTLCYLDRNLNIRSIEIIKNIEISRNFDTFQQLLNKWSNPQQ